MRRTAFFVAIASSSLRFVACRAASSSSGTEAVGRPETDHESETEPTPGTMALYVPQRRVVVLVADKPLGIWRDNRWNAYDPRAYTYPGCRALLRPAGTEGSTEAAWLARRTIARSMAMPSRT